MVGLHRNTSEGTLVSYLCKTWSTYCMSCNNTNRQRIKLNLKRRKGTPNTITLNTILVAFWKRFLTPTLHKARETIKSSSLASFFKRLVRYCKEMSFFCLLVDETSRAGWPHPSAISSLATSSFTSFTKCSSILSTCSVRNSGSDVSCGVVRLKFFNSLVVLLYSFCNGLVAVQCLMTKGVEFSFTTMSKNRCYLSKPKEILMK